MVAPASVVGQPRAPRTRYNRDESAAPLSVSELARVSQAGACPPVYTMLRPPR
jgi:hypothetical protein